MSCSFRLSSRLHLKRNRRILCRRLIRRRLGFCRLIGRRRNAASNHHAFLLCFHSKLCTVDLRREECNHGWLHLNYLRK